MDRSSPLVARTCQCRRRPRQSLVSLTISGPWSGAQPRNVTLTHSQWILCCFRGRGTPSGYSLHFSVRNRHGLKSKWLPFENDRVNDSVVWHPVILGSVTERSSMKKQRLGVASLRQAGSTIHRRRSPTLGGARGFGALGHPVVTPKLSPQGPPESFFAWSLGRVSEWSSGFARHHHIL